jgi:geranylgeranyl diphosphate synthase type I
MDAKETLMAYKAKVDQELKNYFQTKAAQAETEFGKELLENLAEYTLRGGKRIRPTFAVFGFKCFTDADEQAILQASISLEILHGFLIIHDDIMDEDPLRRGGTAFHKIYEDICQKKFSGFRAERFGENMGIVAGDLMHCYGVEIMQKADFPQDRKMKALDKLNDIIYCTSVGQLLDSLNEAKEKVTEDEVLKVHEMKTAKYTIEGPLHLGAILAGASDQDLKVLSAYGIPLGQAFQLQDDILGLFSTEKKIGKPVDSDLKEGKKTLLILKALEKADEKQKELILSALGNQDLKREHSDQVREIVKSTGSYDYSKKLATDLIEQAKNALENADFKPQGKDFLLGIADYMLQREY